MNALNKITNTIELLNLNSDFASALILYALKLLIRLLEQNCMC